MAIELGGNIVLEGFDNRDYTELIVVKKIVGQYARKINDTLTGVQNLRVTLNCEKNKKISGALELKNGSFEATAESENLYVALDQALKQLEKNAYSVNTPA